MTGASGKALENLVLKLDEITMVLMLVVWTSGAPDDKAQLAVLQMIKVRAYYGQESQFHLVVWTSGAPDSKGSDTRSSFHFLLDWHTMCCAQPQQFTRSVKLENFVSHSPTSLAIQNLQMDSEPNSSSPTTDSISLLQEYLKAIANSVQDICNVLQSFKKSQPEDENITRPIDPQDDPISSLPCVTKSVPEDEEYVTVEEEVLEVPLTAGDSQL
ncbi:hypothetical protein EDB19DRAFT_1825370 [Suillus lakei]|nr:hypothetical protein EDB19DRAFT_1825370 [Suillus lakei]